MSMEASRVIRMDDWHQIGRDATDLNDIAEELDLDGVIGADTYQRIAAVFSASQRMNGILAAGGAFTTDLDRGTYEIVTAHVPQICREIAEPLPLIARDLERQASSARPGNELLYEEAVDIVRRLREYEEVFSSVVCDYDIYRDQAR